MGSSWTSHGVMSLAAATQESGLGVVVAGVGDRRRADSTLPSFAVTLDRMYREQEADRDARRSLKEVPPTQRAVVLVGDVTRDAQRIEELLSANVIVILVPSLESAHTLPLPGEAETQAASPTIASVGKLRIDLTEHRVLWGERELPVSEHELAVLATLCREPGRARTFAELAEAEGGKWLGDTERVHAAIKRLRRKLARSGADVRIEAVRGYGFRLVARVADPLPTISGGSAEFSGEDSISPKVGTIRSPVLVARVPVVAALLRTVSPLGILRRVGRALPRLPLRALPAMRRIGLTAPH